MEARNYDYNNTYYDNRIEEIPLPHKKIDNGKKRKDNKIKVKNNYTKYNVKENSRSVGARNNVKESLIVFFGLVSLSLVIITLYSYITIGNINTQISNMNKEITQLETIRDEYKMELSNYYSVEEIEEIAKYKLGMIYPDETQVYYLSDNKE